MSNIENDVPDLSSLPDRSERALRTRPAATVFVHMGFVYTENEEYAELVGVFTRELVRMQQGLIKLWESMNELDGHAITAWMLLNDGERLRHLNKEFEGSFMYVVGRQDARGLVPEITTSALSKQNGKAFLDFVEHCVKGNQGVAVNTAYYHHSVWWDEAFEGLSQSFLEGLDERAYEIMTIQRNTFITKYMLYAGISVLRDPEEGSAGTAVATDMMENNPHMARSVARSLAICDSRRGWEEIHVVWPVKIEAGLPYTLLLCRIPARSLAQPQTKLWKVAKELRGTIHDPFWFDPNVSDMLRNIPSASDGSITMAELGFPNSNHTRPYSSALQRQINLLTTDRDADYFLFDEMDRPIRFTIEDSLLKMNFRIARTEVLSVNNPKGVDTLAEHVIKIMAKKSGLSKAGIIAQFTKEYECDVAGRLAELEKTHIRNPEVTVLESLTQIITDFPTSNGTPV
ncbi:hypothetical protein BDZ94DRAFT_1312644 [Collybia nuda]|uniref:Uncharacterized protein n=1 Tax=Collybia nuda TaxID=64659 RepID=A0A9P6CB62_9AGAR|nr:hypothetical protein BDZ94DRAFT_1312644 [Collybia nuda]